MSEKLYETLEFDLRLKSIVEGAYDLVDKKYGVNGDNPKSYHNLAHTASVVDATLNMANETLAEGKIDSNDKNLMIIAAAYHDTEQQLGSGANEEASCELAIEVMRNIGGFSEKDEKAVKDMIMATKIYFDDKGVMHQSASDDYRTKLIADADLSYLGGPTEIYVEGFICLFQELNPGLGSDSDKFKAFLNNQAPFMINHNFYTQEASRLFSNKNANTDYAKDLANSIS